MKQIKNKNDINYEKYYYAYGIEHGNKDQLVNGYFAKDMLHDGWKIFEAPDPTIQPLKQKTKGPWFYFVIVVIVLWVLSGAIHWWLV